MARIRNEAAYESAKTRLLDVGMTLIRENSFDGIGINDVLRESGVPKGSFYHYFDTKEDFGLEVARHYHRDQLAFAKACLSDRKRSPVERLEAFFSGAREGMKDRGYAQGCLMCNLSTELADQKPVFQAELDRHWQALTGELEICLRETDLSRIGLSHLSPAQAADWLMNSWSGALTRMKASRSDEPLALFMRTIFKKEGK
ncbi:Transcriptional regulator AcuR [Labrenzia sp. THAF35]|uniref:TetR/AcrR family transcriptional regulator n=1 Tax=unclassified Labrenzia TaxID=2648686 RepID=UPI0003B85D77|nr:MULTISPECIES: TetR/AcrR family transcriptional regulator [unclassified Labrenzia]ERP99945.1 TetR family transcriptional regulator [Labrenzia sp. C1B70]MCR9280878.1 TetR/AcrR family transcriptional regulator [Paracoccaceae bacterium]QFT67843.1 Transcriptional regulator AcuR [Labrenzia sp. THAF35]